ncbi:DUF1800 domain-containing protein [Psychromonas ossibalaenae]|uniref:DUF1800 domain-containing protein n=1 Tax=Psychromonas ossibalaenae TaxID=444922 RepID=UPI00036DD3C7|nr:DUF1800 domain-containing protein [Psychromonas ossibalaenae]
MENNIKIDSEREQYAKFLYRATFGPKKGQIDALQKAGYESWFKEQFAAPASYHAPKAQQFADLTNVKVSENMRLGAWWQRTIQAEDQLRQRMAYSLSQIFVVSKHGIPGKHIELAQYYDILVKHAFGNFRDLLEEVTLNPVMGHYLTLQNSQKFNHNKKTYPDENYAREVMQLFTLGLWELQENGEAVLDVDGNKIPTYTQQDIEELARALTGWRRSDYTAPMHGVDNRHDSDEKLILNEYFPSGKTPQQDLTQAMDLLFNHKNTPVLFAELLIKRLTGSNPRGEYIARVASAFKNNGDGVRGDFKAVLTAVLTDSDVVNAEAEQGATQRKTFGRLQEPVITIANQARALDMKSKQERWYDIQYTESQLGQAPLLAPSVFNFYTPVFAPQGEISNAGLIAPEFYLLTTDNMRRIHNRLWGNIYAVWGNSATGWTWDHSEFLALESSPDEYMALLNERLFGGLISTELHDYIHNMLSSEMEKVGPNLRIRNTLYVAFSSPEFFTQE